MVKWEYMYMIVKNIRYDSDTATMKGEMISLSATLNKIGGDGWDIARNEWLHNTAELYFLFKREKSEDQPQGTAPTEPDLYATRRLN